MKDRLAFFISTPESYYDVLSVFLTCYHRFCNTSPYTFYITTNNLNLKSSSNVKVIYSNADTWIGRSIKALKEIDTQYIFLMCDDLIITDYVDFTTIESILDDMRKYHIRFCGFTNHIRGKELYPKSILHYIKKCKPYAINLQSGIFLKSYFMELLGDGENSPWDIEKNLLQEAANSRRGEYFDDIVSCQLDVLHCRNGVRKGKWYYSTLKKINDLGIQVEGDRKVISRKEEIILTVKSVIGKKIPSFLRPIIKKVLHLCGSEFTTNY